MITCSICFEKTTQVEMTPCAHKFCVSCLTKWRCEGKATCPMCRTSLPLTTMPTAHSGPTVSTTTPNVRTYMRPQSSATPMTPITSGIARSIYPNTSGFVRSSVEREHEERQQRRERRLAVEQRLESYRGGWTPSGRPVESLPVVSLDKLRNELAQNRLNLGSSIMASRESLGGV
uniref:RING-type domain-containing protein n=1 Tax=Haptolina brevifila TaxID=156173 RepID=A0A7S2FET1_9EUKA